MTFSVKQTVTVDTTRRHSPVTCPLEVSTELLPSVCIYSSSKETKYITCHTQHYPSHYSRGKMVLRRIPKSIRACVTEFGELIKFDTTTGTVRGFYSETGNYILNVARNIINYTLVKSNEENKLINSETGEYSGCFGKLQRGEADAAAFPSIMSLIGIPNVTQLNTSNLETGVYLFSPFSTEVSTKLVPNDLLNQFQIVSLEVWSIALLLTIYFWTVLTALKRLYRLGHKVGRFHKFFDPLYGQSVSYQVATHMLQTETCGYIRFKERFVSILMSLFAFLFITFFTNMITSSKVSARSFFAYDSYEKILANKNVQPVWVSLL